MLCMQTQGVRASGGHSLTQHIFEVASYPPGQASTLICSKMPRKPPDSRFIGAIHKATNSHENSRKKKKKIFSGILRIPPKPSQPARDAGFPYHHSYKFRSGFISRMPPALPAPPPAAACHLPSTPSPTCPSSVKSYQG